MFKIKGCLGDKTTILTLLSAEIAIREHLVSFKLKLRYTNRYLPVFVWIYCQILELSTSFSAKGLMLSFSSKFSIASQWSCKFFPTGKSATIGIYEKINILLKILNI